MTFAHSADTGILLWVRHRSSMERGDIVFGTAIGNSGNGVTLYQLTQNDQLRLVIPDGRSPMPGGSAGDTYSVSDDDSVFTPPHFVLNDVGQISFMAGSFRTTGLFPGNFGLWIEQSPGDVRARLRSLATRPSGQQGRCGWV